MIYKVLLIQTFPTAQLNVGVRHVLTQTTKLVVQTAVIKEEIVVVIVSV